MDENLQHQLAQRLSELPPDIQAAIHSADLPKKVQAIGQKYQLHIDQIWQLDDEVMLVMLGFAEPDMFVRSLVREVRIPETAARLIATDVSNELFMPIRESMRHFTEARESQDKAVPSAPTSISTPPPAPVDVPTKPEFPKADVMLTQKTVTPPASAAVASSVHEAAAVPPKLGALTTPPPVMPKAPTTFVTTPAPASHTAPPMTTLPPKIPSAPAPLPPTAPAPIPPAPPSASVPTQPTPPAPTQSGYKTDPYREPIE